ncbi:MAG: hypothetical protein IKF78_07380 [Atopobiaceae bacterium]|nr:hypothetical protein [Atopobiaceae bacterium]
MNFYPENFVVRLLICLALAFFATTLGTYVRQVVIDHGTFTFDMVKNLGLPLLLGVVAALFWKPRRI